MSKKLSGYFPVLLLFCAALVVGLFTYQEYGVSWDEQYQRMPGLLSYNYIFHNDQSLLKTYSDNHGAAFELFLAIIEKSLNITKERDIYLMRHLVSHIVFLLGALSLGMLAYRQFGSRLLSCLCFVLMLCMPRIYAHSFFNSKDVPFMALMAIAISLSQLAFSRQRYHWFLWLGIVSGFATSIRIMGIIMFCIICFFLLLDFIASGDTKKKIAIAVSGSVFIVAYIAAVYISWPYLWHDPVNTFLDSIKLMANYNWGGIMLLQGEVVNGSSLPWTYFPIWFSITTPELWLIAGCLGMLLFIYKFIKEPILYLKNTPERIFSICFLCFIGPVCTIILLHSVIYDDWRHLYFVYPGFVFLAIGFFRLLLKTKYRMFTWLTASAQVLFTGWFMINNLSFNQVYFNTFVSHKPEFIRMNYEFDYWGCGYKQALDYLLKIHPSGEIKVATHGIQQLLIDNNKLLMEDSDKKRIKVVPEEECDYFITNFRLHSYDFPYLHLYSIKILNSTVIRIYKLH